MVRGKQVGIRDVAEAAGVSLTTVSHALNDVEGARIAEDTRVRVLEAAKRLGYGPNRLARGLRMQRSGILGLISDSIATTPFAGRIVTGAQEAARALGQTLLLSNTQGDPEAEAADIAILKQHQVDGFILATMYHRRVTLPPSLADVPFVLVDGSCDDTSVPAAVPAEQQGAQAAVEELIAAGHRRIAYIGNHDDIPASPARLAGYRAALRGAKIRFERRLVTTAEPETWGGYAAFRQLLDRGADLTAVFCFNDRVAMGVYQAAAEAGLRIPDELSVIGFDDQPVLAAGLLPPLTTMALPHYELGRWAVESLMSLIETGAIPGAPAAYPLELPCPIVRRGSVAPPAR